MSKSFSNRSNANRYLAKMDHRADFRVVPAGDRFEVVPVVVEVPAEVVSLDDAAANGRDAFFDGRNAEDCPYAGVDAHAAWIDAFAKARDEALADKDAALAAAAEEQEAADAEARAKIDPPPPAPDTLLLEVSVSKDEADAVARFISTRFRRAVVVSVPSGRVLKTVGGDTAPPVKAKAPRTAKAPGTGTPRAPKADPTVKPVITAPSQQKMQQVFDRIEAARGDTAKLQALNTFKRSATYTKMAGRYLDALLAEAAGKAA